MAFSTIPTRTTADANSSADINQLQANDTAITTGWIDAEETWTYATANTFTISGDKTGKYGIGDKIKLTQTTVKYFYIVAISYGAPNTTVTVHAGTDYTLTNAAITLPYYSKHATPQGFPDYFNYTPTVTAQSGTITSYTVNIAKYSIKGKILYFTFKITITDHGTGSGGMQVTLPFTIITQHGSISGREIVIIGKGLCGEILDTYLQVFNADVTTVLVDTAVTIFTGMAFII